MYRNSYQRGMLTVFFSGGSKPLGIWETHCQDGYITRFLDQDIKSMVLEIGGTNVSTTYMTCPKGKTVLGITMPFLIMVVKNLKKYFSFEVTILDETSTRRRFRVSNFQSTTQILPLCTVMPIGLSDGWNQIQFNLAEFTRRAYKKQFVEVQKIKINANIRLRRIYFTERLIPEDELPPEYKLFFPIPSKGKKKGNEVKENVKPPSLQNILPEERKSSKAEVDKVSPKASVRRVSQDISKTRIEEVSEPVDPTEAIEKKLTEVEVASEVEEEKAVVDETQDIVEAVEVPEQADGELGEGAGEETVPLEILSEPATDAPSEPDENDGTQNEMNENPETAVENAKETLPDVAE